MPGLPHVDRPRDEASPRLAPRLIVITDVTRVPAALLPERVEPLLALARPGSVLLMLRDRQLAVRSRLELGRALVTRVRRHGQLFSVNDRLDLALLLGADAVHLPENGLTPEDARRLIGARFISRATHDAERPALEGADALLLSPVLEARKGRAAIGLQALERARARLESGLLYALGGIDADGARACRARGADGVAAIGAVLDGAAPEPLLAALGALR